jgi:hypothetical protein
MNARSCPARFLKGIVAKDLLFKDLEIFNDPVEENVEPHIT